MKKLNELRGQCLFVINGINRLVGSITDGDIRRALIKGVLLSETVSKAMKANFIFARENSTQAEKQMLLKQHKIDSIPVLNEKYEVLDIFTNRIQLDHSDIEVVILAGGLGTRLGIITQDVPKPMVQVAGKPILERILNRLLEQGFKKFYFSVNYKAEKIEEYFKDGVHLGCEIDYLRENKRLGTAGPLSLLKSNRKSPIVVMNGDLLTSINFEHLINFHDEHASKLTMCIRSHEVQIPFGVVNVVDGFAKEFVEKPTYAFNVNAGIYMIDREMLEIIPLDEYYDMSTLLNHMLEKDIPISCFPIVESWIDVGHESDLIRASESFSKS